jgi:hypothetical protein
MRNMRFVRSLDSSLRKTENPVMRESVKKTPPAQRDRVREALPVQHNNVREGVTAVQEGGELRGHHCVADQYHEGPRGLRRCSNP